jgi:hypothetical protein
MENVKQNPLQKYFRQPKIYIRLPSSGNFYPPGALDRSENGEYAVYSMTAKDEIIMKTPDALLNGQATVDVIQSCVPAIKDAWKVPSLDVDAILVAIRIATYGETLDVNAVVPGLDEAKTYETDLRVVLDKLLNAAYEPVCQVNDSITVHLRPLTYAELTLNNVKTTEEQRLIRIVSDQELSEEQKLAQFRESFLKLTDVTIGMISKSVVKVIADGQVVDDTEFINDFINNTDKDILKKIIDHLAEQKKKFEIEPFKIVTTEEERAAGAPEIVEVPITLDSSNFFV